LGCLLYRHCIANPALGAPARLWAELGGLGVTALFIGIIVNLSSWKSPIVNHWDWIFVLFIFPALTYFALQEKTILNKILSSPLFVFLGSISYSVYLLHVQVALLYCVVSSYLFNSLPPIPYAGFVDLLCTIGVATLTYKFIEVPARKALRGRLEVFFRKLFYVVK
jgi:peptidoglycan/LPS O-acetylase OafA/YrhL